MTDNNNFEELWQSQLPILQAFYKGVWGDARMIDGIKVIAEQYYHERDAEIAAKNKEIAQLTAKVKRLAEDNRFYRGEIRQREENEAFLKEYCGKLQDKEEKMRKQSLVLLEYVEAEEGAGGMWTPEEYVAVCNQRRAALEMCRKGDKDAA